MCARRATRCMMVWYVRDVRPFRSRAESRDGLPKVSFSNRLWGCAHATPHAYCRTLRHDVGARDTNTRTEKFVLCSGSPAYGLVFILASGWVSCLCVCVCRVLGAYATEVHIVRLAMFTNETLSPLSHSSTTLFPPLIITRVPFNPNAMWTFCILNMTLAQWGNSARTLRDCDQHASRRLWVTNVSRFGGTQQRGDGVRAFKT